VRVAWDLFSLKAINSGNESLREGHFKSEPSLRVMSLLRLRHAVEEANRLIDRLYLAIGRAAFEEEQDIGQHDVVAAALEACALSPALLDEALADSATLDDLLRSHDESVALGAFGVPSLVFEGPGRAGPSRAMYGPIFNLVPTGEDALRYWDSVEWLCGREEFFELKRERGKGKG
jgi:hypothetical protein